MTGNASTSPTPPNDDVDTNSWDTVVAMGFIDTNNALVSNWSKVSDKAKNVEATADDDPGFHVSGVLGPWQLIPLGDGKNIRMSCPFVSGTYTAEGKSYDLGAAKTQAHIEIGMEWVPNPGQFFFVIGDATVTPIYQALDKSTLDTELRDAFTAQGKTLGQSADVTVVAAGKEWMISDGGDNYYIFRTIDKYENEFLNIYQFQKAWENNLKILAEEIDGEPPVVLVNIIDDPAPKSVAAVLAQLLSDWFNENIGEFNHVFASLDLSPIISAGDKYAWMKPTSTSYAVADGGSLESGVFGVLTMALNRPSPDKHMVAPNAIPSGADAAFLIAGTMFMQNMLLAGAQSIFNNAPMDAFDIENDGLTVRNTRDLVWGKFMMDEKQLGSLQNEGYSPQLDQKQLSPELINALMLRGADVSQDSVEVIAAGSQWLLSDGKTEYILGLDGSNLDVYEATVVTIAKGQFTMSLNHTYVEIEFIDLLYSYNADFDVHINYTEQVQLSLKEQNGKKIFWFDQVLKNQVVTVSRTQEAITRAIVEGAVVGALTLVALAGPIFEGLAAGARIGAVTEDGGEALISADTFAEVEAANPEAAEADLADSGQVAAQQTGGRLTNIKNAFATPKWKLAGTVAGLAGAAAGVDKTISEIIEAAAQDKWENVPGFDEFADIAIAPYTFPSVAGFTLKSADLAGSLQIGLTVNQA